MKRETEEFGRGEESERGIQKRLSAMMVLLTPDYSRTFQEDDAVSDARRE